MDVQYPIRKVLRLAVLSSVLVVCAALFAQAQQPILRAPDFDQPELLPQIESDAPAEPQPLSTEPSQFSTETQLPTFEPQQPADVSTPEPELPAVETVLEPQQLQPEQRQPTAADASCPNCGAQEFWIVSSRNCCKEGERCFAQCPLDYFYVGSDGARRPANQQQFVDSLEPGAPVCIVVHGSFASWKDVCSASPDLYQWLRAADPTRRTRIVFYTWPSESPHSALLHIDFGVLGRRSADHGFHLSRLMSTIPADRPLSLLGHSHGTRCISSALQLRAGGEVQGMQQGVAPDFNRRIRVVFAAAAIDSHWLNPGQRYGRALSGVEFLLNLTSHGDSALAWYPFRKIFSNEALGITGFTQRNRQAMGQWAYKVADMDVTRFIGSGHFWRNYLRYPQIANAMAPTLFYLDAPSQQPSAAPSQAARSAAPGQTVIPTIGMTTVPRRSTQAVSPVRETFSDFGRTLPAGRM